MALNGYRLAAVCDARQFGGAERVLEVLLAHLPSSVEATVVGADPVVVGRLAAARPGCAAVVAPERVGERRRAFRRARVDVVHVNLPGLTDCRSSIAAALLQRSPVVLVDHLPTPGLRRRGRALQRLTTALCAARVSVGHHSARLVERYAGLPDDSVLAIHNGVPPLDVIATPPSEERLRVAMLCRLVPEKGVDLLLAAMAQLPAVSAVIAGAGPCEAALRARAAALALGDRVVFLGTADPAAVLSAADAVVLPSRREGLPLTLIEAMHAGLPVVASRVGSIPEAVTDGLTGLLIDPDDAEGLAAALAELAASPQLRATLGAAARRRAGELFSPTRMAQAYDALYRSALR